jgi:hypothetical protein
MSVMSKVSMPSDILDACDVYDVFVTLDSCDVHDVYVAGVDACDVLISVTSVTAVKSFRTLMATRSMISFSCTCWRRCDKYKSFQQNCTGKFLRI